MKRLIALVLVAAGLLAATPALAWHYGHGPRVSLGFSYGGYWGPGPFWGAPWYPSYYYPPTVIVTSPPQPVQYIERPAAQPQVQAQAGLQPGYWYFCENPSGYYPHIKECPSPWKAVAPVPPPNTQ
jgi:hypothetical protein